MPNGSPEKSNQPVTSCYTYHKKGEPWKTVSCNIPLADRPHQYGNHVIALALVQQSNGEKKLVYIAHDPASGRPVIQDNQ